MVFKMKSLTYKREEDKCVFAASRLAGTLLQEWNVKEQRIFADPACAYSYKQFKAFLQEHKLPSHV